MERTNAQKLSDIADSKQEAIDYNKTLEDKSVLINLKLDERIHRLFKSSCASEGLTMQYCLTQLVKSKLYKEGKLMSCCGNEDYV